MNILSVKTWWIYKKKVLVEKARTALVTVVCDAIPNEVCLSCDWFCTTNLFICRYTYNCESDVKFKILSI